MSTYTNGCQPLDPIVQGKGLFFSVEDQKKIYQAAAKDKMLNMLLAGTPEYRLNINQRHYYDLPRMTESFEDHASIGTMPKCMRTTRSSIWCSLGPAR